MTNKFFAGRVGGPPDIFTLLVDGIKVERHFSGGVWTFVPRPCPGWMGDMAIVFSCIRKQVKDVASEQ